MAKNAPCELLHSLTLSDVATRLPIYSFSRSDPLSKIISFFAEKRMLSAPVLDSTGKCIGVVDVLDAAAFITKVQPDMAKITNDHIDSLKEASKKLNETPLVDVINRSENDVMIALEMDSTLLTAAQLFGVGVHRTPIYSKLEGGSIISLVTQSDLIRFLATSLDLEDMKTFFSKSLESFKLGEGGGKAEGAKLITVKGSDNLASAIRALTEARVSAVAVVDDAGKLSGNLSVSDLAAFWSSDNVWHLLCMKVDAYLKQFSPRSTSPILIARSSTLGDAIKKMVRRRVHRLWVVDDAGKATGIVAMTDVFRAIVV